MHDSAIADCETLLEAHDVARAIDRTPATVQQLTNRGVLRPAARTPRGIRLYRQADVDRLVEQRKAGAGR